jgi:hypothetical protein
VRQLVGVELVVAWMFASSHWHLVDRLMSGASFTAKVCLLRKQGTAEWSLLSTA